MNPEKRLEILEAFASSKPTEFDGFAKLYVEQHPEQIDAVVPLVVEEEKPKRKRNYPKPVEEVLVNEPE